MVLSTSAGAVSAKTTDTAVSGYTSGSDVSDASSAASTTNSVSRDVSAVTLVGDTLVTASVPTGLSGAGTTQNPYQISSSADLLAMNDYINYDGSSDKHFKLMNDISLSALTFSDFANSDGIYALVSAKATLSGNSNIHFVLDGNGKKLSGLNVTVPADVLAAGIFGLINANSSVRNLKIENCFMRVSNTTDGAYGLLSVQNKGTISGCSLTDCSLDLKSASVDSMESGDEITSLACGKLCKGNSLVTVDNGGTITGCTVTGTDSNKGIFVKGARKFVGFIAGQNRKIIEDCTVSGMRVLAYGSNDSDSEIAGSGMTATYIGGIAGRNNVRANKTGADGSIANCSVTFSYGADMLFGDMVGGITGSNAGKITSSQVNGTCTSYGSVPSEAAANIFGTGRFGGVAGVNAGSIESCGTYDLSFCFSKNDSSNIFGGVAGSNSGTITACVASGNVNINGSTDASTGGIAGSAASGTTVSGCYALMHFSAQTGNSGAVLGKGGTLGLLGRNNYWISSVSNMIFPVPGDGVGVNDLTTSLSVINVPVGTSGIEIKTTDISNTWSGNADAKVRVDTSMDASCSNSVIFVSQTSSSFLIQSVSNGEFGDFYYYGTVNLSEIGVGASGKNVTVRLSAPVLVSTSTDSKAGTDRFHPIVLTTYEQLKFIQYAPNAHYKLGTDITVGSDWSAVSFGGTLDGDGYSLTISQTLFDNVIGSRGDGADVEGWETDSANLSTGYIKNLNIIAGARVTGAVFHTVSNATLEGVTYSAPDEGGYTVINTAAGGALVSVLNGNVYMSRCYVSAKVNVTASSSNGIGALIGRISADNVVIDNCGSASAMLLSGGNLSKVGGLVGYVAGVSGVAKFSNCYASGSVYAESEFASFAPYIMFGAMDSSVSTSSVTDCYYSVAEESVSGGTVAKKAAPFTNGIKELSFDDGAYNVATSGTTTVQLNMPSTLSACSALDASDFTFVFGSSEIELAEEPTASGNVLTFVVRKEASAGSEYSVPLTVTQTSTGLKASVTLRSGLRLVNDGEADYYEIYTKADLQQVIGWLRQTNASTKVYGTITAGTMRSANFKLCADIDMSGVTLSSTSKWMCNVVGMAFRGKFVGKEKSDGSKYTISNLVINGGTTCGVGLFGYAQDATFRNFRLDGFTVTGSSSTGALLGVADVTRLSTAGAGTGTTTVCSFSDIEITNCEMISRRNGSPTPTASNANFSDMGTLCGSVWSTNTSKNYEITNIYVSDCILRPYSDSTQTFRAYAVGGLIGEMRAKNTLNIGSADTPDSVVINNVNITGYSFIGGVLGKAGGLPVGANFVGTFTTTYNVGKINMQNVTVQGGSTISAGLGTSGGVCGGLIGSECVSVGGLTIKNCTFKDSEVISNCLITSNNTYGNIGMCGGIAGYASGVIDGCKLVNSKVTAGIAGGILGRTARKANNTTSSNVTITNCYILDGSEIRDNEGNSPAAELGGIISSAFFATVTIRNCGIGRDAKIHEYCDASGTSVGEVMYAGGIMATAQVSEDDSYVTMAEANKYRVTVENCTVSGKVESLVAVTGSGVGGVVAFSNIPPAYLKIDDCAVDGELNNNNSMTGGIMAKYTATDPGTDVVINCTVAASINKNTPVTTTLKTTKLICSFGDITFADSWVNDPTTIFHDNIYSSYPEDALPYGFSDGGLQSLEGTALYSALEATYTDVNKPNGMYLDGLTESFVIDGSVENPKDMQITNVSSYVGYTSDSRLSPKLTNSSSEKCYGGWYSMANGLLTVSKVILGGTSYYEKVSSDATNALLVVSDESTAASGQICLSDVQPANFECKVGDYVALQDNTSGNTVLTLTALKEAPATSIGTEYIVNGHTVPGTQEPVLLKVYIPVSCTNIMQLPLDGEGTQESPFLIKTKDDLNSIRNRDMSACYALAADIEFVSEDFEEGKDFFNNNLKFIPIGYDIETGSVTPFTGSFTCEYGGTLYYLGGIEIAASSDYTGLFASAENATFSNIYLDKFKVDTTGSCAGALVGVAQNTVFSDIEIYNTDITASVYAGSLAAYVKDTTVSTVHAEKISVTKANYVGGLFGHAASFSAADSTSIQNVTMDSVTVSSKTDLATNIAAGVVGEFSGTMTNVSLSKGTVSGPIASGVIGYAEEDGAYYRKATADDSNTLTVIANTADVTEGTIRAVQVTPCFGGIAPAVGDQVVLVSSTLTEKNVTLTNLSVDGSCSISSAIASASAGAAGILAKVRHSTEEDNYDILPVNLVLDNCSVGKNVSVSAYVYAGGLVGNVDMHARGTVTIRNSSSFASVDARDASSASPLKGTAAAILAHIADLSLLTIDHCNAGGRVTAAIAAGGVIGLADTTKLETAKSLVTNTTVSAPLNFNMDDSTKGLVIGSVATSILPADFSTTPFTNIYYSSYQVYGTVTVTSDEAHSVYADTVCDLQTNTFYRTKAGKLSTSLPLSGDTVKLVLADEDIVFNALASGAVTGTYKNFTTVSDVAFTLDTIYSYNADNKVLFTWNSDESALVKNAEVNGSGTAVFAYSNGIEIGFTVLSLNIDGEGSEDSPFIITEISHLDVMKSLSNYHYRLGATLDFSTTEGEQWVSEWNTSFKNVNFSGTFTGTPDQSYAIENLTLESTTGDVGFFRELSGTVDGIVFTNCTFTSATEGSNAGVVAAINNGTISNVTVSECTVSAPSHVGAVVGVSLGTVSGCTVANNTTVGTATVGETTITAHCAGGVAGAALQVSDCTVRGTTVTATDMAGGVVGGNLEISEASALGVEVSKLNTTVIRNCNASDVTVTSNYYSGGIFGKAEAGDSDHYRSISITDSTLDAEPTDQSRLYGVSSVITADNSYMPQAGYGVYAGGMLGGLEAYYNGFVINGCASYGSIVAHGPHRSSTANYFYGSAGAMFGGTVVSNFYHLSESVRVNGVNVPTNKFSIVNNVCGGEIQSTHYAGGIAGRFLSTPSSQQTYGFVKGDLMSGNVVSAVFTEIEPYVKNETITSALSRKGFGIVLGIGANNIFNGTNSIECITSNFYSSDVTKQGVMAGLSAFGTYSLSGVNAMTGCVLYDVATGTDGKSFLVKNRYLEDGVLGEYSDFEENVNGCRYFETDAENVYPKPVMVSFAMGNNAVSADLGLQGSMEPVYSVNDTVVRQLQLKRLTAEFTGSSCYSCEQIELTYSYTDENDNTITEDRYAANLTVYEANCTHQPELVADLGYGLKIYLTISPDGKRRPDGKPNNPFIIDSEDAFVDYFFGLTAKNSTNNAYLSKYYRQTVDLDFALIISKIESQNPDEARAVAFAPIGVDENTPFTGGYDGGGYRISGFTYSAASEHVGLFGYVADDVSANNGLRLENIHIELADAGVSGGTNTGGLVGTYTSNETITNCSVVYGVVTGVTNVGGLVGSMCDTDKVGGTVKPSLDGCFTSTSVRTTSADSDYLSVAVGGIVGFQNVVHSSRLTSFYNCFSSSDVVGPYFTGGFIGMVGTGEIELKDCSNTATVTSNRQLNGNTTSNTSLMVGYKKTASGGVTGAGTTYVTANNVFVGGTNATEYNYTIPNGSIYSYYYPVLFGMVPLKSGGNGIYYDATSLGRISVPTGVDTNTDFLTIQGELKTLNGSDSSRSSTFHPMTTSALTSVSFTDLGDNWVASDGDLYPYLKVGAMFNDTYSDMFAKLCAMPVFMDSREADDISADRLYTGITYPSMISAKVDGYNLSIKSSEFSSTTDTQAYPDGYDAKLYGQITADNAGNYTGNSDKTKKDLLFKADCDLNKEGAEPNFYSILRNSYLNCGDSSVSRDEKSPAVTLTIGNYTRDNGTENVTIELHRDVRIPLRGDSRAVYIATERQLRAIMNSMSSGKVDSTADTKFYNAYSGALEKDVHICADIDMSEESFIPISGYVGADGQGTFDGGNCYINKLTISKIGTPNVGMFDTLNTGSPKLSNIILKNVNITGGNYTGALVGVITNSNVLINNCMVITDDTQGVYKVSGDDYVGGLFGYITGCSVGYEKTGYDAAFTPKQVSGASVDVEGANHVGGFAGAIKDANVSNCFAKGNVSRKSGGTVPNAGEMAVGGFVGYAMKSGTQKGTIQYSFASGNVTADFGTIRSAGTSDLNIGIGGFAGVTDIPVLNCFASGDVHSAVSGDYTVGSQIYHGVGGLVGFSKTQSVTNCYSSSIVTYDPRSIPDSTLFVAAVGGVVGYSNVSVSQAYSSGSVISYTGSATGSGRVYNGGVVGYASSADHVYFDKWTNNIQDLHAVGNMTDSTYVGSFTTDEFCNGTLLTASEGYLSDAVWGCDTSANSNTYPYLLSFCESTASDYVRYPAVLSVVAVRPNDRDEAVKQGIGYSMALTVPNSLKMAYIEDGVTTMRTYKLAWDSGLANTNDGSGLIVYGDNTIAPIRTKNIGQDLCIVMWVESFSLDNEDGTTTVVTGCYEKSNRFNSNASEVVADDVTIADGAKQIHVSDVKDFGKGDYTPSIGDYIVTQSFKEYGTRTVRKFFLDMRGTEEHPYMISSARDLQHIGFKVVDGVITNELNDLDLYPDLYAQWYSPLDADGNNMEGTVYFKFITNVDMTKKVVVQDGVATTAPNDETFLSIPSMVGNNYNGIAFSGIVLDGDDYAVDNFSADSAFITTLDADSTIQNLIFNNTVLSAEGDIALIGTNKGTVDGMMVLSDVENGSSITSTSGSAAGIAVANNGVIRNSIVQSAISGSRYIGAIAAENNDTIVLCAADSDLSAKAGTLGIGGLVGRNANAGDISSSFTLGTVNASAEAGAYAGGFVGRNDGVVKYSYSRVMVNAAYPNAGSFVGSNTVDARITDAFSAGKTMLSGTTASTTGSAFAGTNTGTLAYAFADKALLGSNTYMLTGDAEVTENIIAGVCFSADAPFTYAVDDTAYPQLSDILAGDPNQAADTEYVLIKYRLLQGYSTLASVTVDSAYAQYVDALAPVSNPISQVGADYTVTPSGSVSSGAGNLKAQTLPSKPISQKISAGSTTTDDDLKYNLSFSFDYVVQSPASNPNFNGGTGSSADPYVIGTNGGYTAANSFASLAYFGKAADANFKLAEDITFGGDALVAPITALYGSLDGNGHTISDLTIADNSGLFGTIKGTVQNLGLVGLKVDGTSSAAQTNFGLLAGTADGATIRNVYAVGELQVADNSSLATAVHTGGLVGYAKNSDISGVVTSGYVRSDHTAVDSTTGGVVGLMDGGSLSAAESTAYVYGQKYVGGIVGKEINGSLANVIFAGTATGDASAAISNIAPSRSAEVGGIAYYDKQVARVNEDAYTAMTTTKLVKTAVDGAFVKDETKKFYPNPVTIPVSATDSFKNGLNFALARINVTLGGGEGQLDCYDQISVTTPVGNEYDTVKLAEVAPNDYMEGDGTAALTPNGGSAHGLTQVTATLSTQSGSTFQNTVNPIYRYLEPEIIRVIEVEYEIADNTGSLESSQNIGLMIRPEMTGELKISSDAVTNIEQDSAHTNTVRFGKIVVTGSGFFVDTILPDDGNYTYSVSLDDNGTADGYSVSSDSTFVTLGSTDKVKIIVTISGGSAVWGLRSLSNGLN